MWTTTYIARYNAALKEVMADIVIIIVSGSDKFLTSYMHKAMQVSHTTTSSILPMHFTSSVTQGE